MDFIRNWTNLILGTTPPVLPQTTAESGYFSGGIPGFDPAPAPLKTSDYIVPNSTMTELRAAVGRPATLAWGSKVSPEFRAGVFALSAAMGWPDQGGMDSSKFMSCSAFETGNTFDPAIRNKAGSSGTGLIQFMNATAEGLGTTTDALAAMTAPEQLKYCLKYLQMFSKLKNRSPLLSDVYMAILLPKYIGEPDSAVLFTDGLAYQQNAGLDTNKDHRITKGEVAARIQGRLALGLQPGNVWTGTI